MHGGDRLFHWLTGLFPAGARQRLREAGPVAFGVIGRYIRGVAIVGGRWTRSSSGPRCGYSGCRSRCRWRC
ncbi:hypothetical protein ACFSTC_45320 [Nonomuraea ferruginea]